MKGLLMILILPCSSATVLLFGEPYCSTSSDDVSYALPGTTISITCVTDNPDGGDNALIWNSPVPISHFNVQPNNLVSIDGFSSRVNSVDGAEKITNATLTFTANEDLDEVIVTCRGVIASVTNSCSLFILTPPSALTSFVCTNITNDSLTLQWGEPTDNGGEEELQYNITGTPGDISIVVGGNNVAIENLLPNTTYSLSIRAGNAVGFGSESSMECTTEKNRPPMFMTVSVCLSISDNNPESAAELIVIYSPCPLPTNESTTPAVTSYRVVVDGSDIPVNDSSSCDFSEEVSTDDVSALTVDVYANNIVGSTRTSYRNGRMFYASWIRDVSVTDVTSSSAVIQYTTADCVLSSDLIVELITPNSSMVDGNTTHDYENETTSSFSFTSLTPNEVVTFTLQVTVASTTVYATTSSFTVLPMPTAPTTTSTPSDTNNITPNSTTGSPSDTPTPTSDPPTAGTADSSSSTSQTSPTSTSTARTANNVQAIIGGIAGAVFAVVAVIVIILAIIACYMYYKKCSNNKTSVDLLHVKEGSKDDPIPLHESKGPLPETGQALYQDPTTIERQQAPTGDLYALPDKPRIQPPPPDSSATEAATYQDPNTIERQQAPTGDTYAMPQKKIQSLKVDEANKGSPAMYAELGFEDSSQPLLSPSGQPLLPKDTTQVMYAEVSEHRQ